MNGVESILDIEEESLLCIMLGVTDTEMGKYIK